MSYNLKAANPFTSARSEWSGNNLILQDAELRARAGVTVLDKEVADVFQIQPLKGGAASGAPFHMKNYGAPNARPYDQNGAGYGLPRHYFDNDKRW